VLSHNNRMNELKNVGFQGYGNRGNKSGIQEDTNQELFRMELSGDKDVLDWYPNIIDKHFNLQLSLLKYFSIVHLLN
jgi:hypothetical protein